jgi:hypothetical protein
MRAQINNSRETFEHGKSLRKQRIRDRVGIESAGFYRV